MDYSVSTLVASLAFDEFEDASDSSLLEQARNLVHGMQEVLVPVNQYYDDLLCPAEGANQQDLVVSVEASLRSYIVHTAVCCTAADLDSCYFDDQPCRIPVDYSGVHVLE